MRSKFLLTTMLALALVPTAMADTTPLSTPLPAAPATTTPPPVLPGNGAVTILYKFVPNQDLKYAMQSTTSGSVNMVGRSMPLTETMTADYHMFTKSVDKDDNGTMQMAIDNVAIKMNVNGQTVSMPASAMQNAMSGTTVTMSPLGKVVSFTAPAGSAAQSAMNNVMSPGQMNNLAILPDHPVNIGDAWRGSMNLANLGAQAFLKMTLNGVNSLTGTNVANIGVKMYMNITPSSATAAKLSGIMNGQGTMAFDLDNGYQKSFNEDMTMNLAIAPPTGAATNRPVQGGNINMTINTTMNLLSATILPAGTSPIPPIVPTQTAPAPATGTAQ